MDYDQLPRSALVRLLQDHDAALADAGKDGIVMNYTGRTAPWQIIRQVKPKLSRIVIRQCEGDAQAQCQNEIWDGENLSAMVTLYKYRGQVDLILTDPPYNTGEDFRYNDKWDKDPNDPDLGELVPKDDGSRHSKWLKFMTPRVWMMRDMLKPGGVIAICIDHRELFRLGMLMDEVFREENRLGIINWQKAYSPKNDTGGKNGGLSSATEYVLVYAKNAERAKTGLLNRTEVMDARYTNPDNDPGGRWSSSDATAPEYRKTGTYAIQSPFTGKLFYPTRGHWVSETSEIKRSLEAWGSSYVTKTFDDKCQAEALVLLIEQGNTDKGDHYAKTLTADRIRRVITGEWKSGKRDPLLGGFRFIELKKEKIDAEAVNALAREEMIDLLLTSHWDKAERANSYLRRLPIGQHRYLFAVNSNDEGFFLIWESPSKKSMLDREAYKTIVAEAKTAGLTLRAHVYASIAPYTGSGIEFYKIPDKVLEHMGFNPRSDAFNNEETADDGA